MVALYVGPFVFVCYRVPDFGGVWRLMICSDRLPHEYAVRSVLLGEEAFSEW